MTLGTKLSTVSSTSRHGTTVPTQPWFNSPLPGLGFWNVDMSLGKSTNITERVKVVFSADFFNIFNHANFLDPSFDTTTPSTFGVINTQLVPADRIQGSRWIQIGFRVNF